VPSAAAAAPPALPEGAGEPEARLDGDDGKGDTVTLDFTPTPILLRVSSQAERRWRAHACAKEPWTVEWLLQEVRPGEMLYDIGANVGTFALIGAKHCGASVVAFEPGAASFARLCENIHLNGCARAVVPVPLPLADTVGLTGFKYRSMEAGQSRHFLRDDAWTPGRVDPAGPGGHYIQPVCTTTLDAVIRDYRLPPPAHVKLDVDGAEVRVLRGAAAALRAPTLRTILIEAADDTWSDVERLLTAAGFRVRAQHVREHKTDAPRYAVFERGR
jgi:FkbM family methyltransferase